MEKILVTGGAGFIGNTIISKLYQNKNYKVIVLDNFSKQIHGDDFENSYLYQNIKGKCEIIKGDVCNISDVSQALEGVDYIIHLAAETGTGQSMYEINRYTNVNILGTSNILQSIINNNNKIKKIILSSSRSIYGEGMYFCETHGNVVPKSRKISDMKNRDFTVKCPICNQKVTLKATKEESPSQPISFYAYTKLAQEKMLLTMCPSLDIPYTIFRYQNVYGIGQSLNNPYTGILSIFSKLLLKNKEINIFEDGKESRDFINVNDVADITLNAISNQLTDNQIINVGSGERITVMEVANLLKTYYKSKSDINITGDFRKGDIRHNIADIERAKKLCNISLKYDFSSGMKDFTDWVMKENSNNINFDNDSIYEKSLEELENTGMLIHG